MSSQDESRDRVARNVGLALLALAVVVLCVFLSGKLRLGAAALVVIVGLVEVLGEAHVLRRLLRQLIYGERLL